MEKFNKLSRDEMKDVLGGNVKQCIAVCDAGLPPNHPWIIGVSVPDCSTETQNTVCSGAQFISCSC